MAYRYYFINIYKAKTGKIDFSNKVCYTIAIYG